MTPGVVARLQGQHAVARSTSGTSRVTSAPGGLLSWRPTSTCVNGDRARHPDRPPAVVPVNSGSTATRTATPRTPITAVEVSLRSACLIPS